MYAYLSNTLSWMMQGIIDYLLSNAPEARLLRDSVVFKIVPMLNMDGVVEGNHRFSLATVDLNRQWLHPDRSQHATIYHTKLLIMQVS
jgi:murein tripeptide amidase MpaA